MTFENGAPSKAASQIALSQVAPPKTTALEGLSMLKACVIELKEPSRRAEVVQDLRNGEVPMLVLDTCQRLETYSFTTPTHPEVVVQEIWNESGALLRLSRIAAGLQSRILGELEILGQVRNAYKVFQSSAAASDTRLDRVFQDVLAIARKARKHSGIDQNLTSLGGLAAREMIESLDPQTPVAVMGSGSLARSVTRYLKKRGGMPIRVASRCPENAFRLAAEFGCFASGIENLTHLFEGVGGIICATAAPHPVVYAEHLNQAKKPLKVIDLGEPADCDISVQELPYVDYADLLTVEDRAQLNSDERKNAASIAERIIQDAVAEWHDRRVRS